MTDVPKFVLFGSLDTHYASGGWHDMLGTFSTAGDAAPAARLWKVREEWMDDEDFADARVIEWWHVVDMTTGKIVLGTASQAYGAPYLAPHQIADEPTSD